MHFDDDTYEGAMGCADAAMDGVGDQWALCGAGAADPSIFDGFSYVALGHLHRPQLVGGDERIAYCGSPIPYSFSETEPKSLRIVDLAADGTLEGVATIPVEAGWPVATIEGSFDELVADERFAEFEKRCFVRAVLTDRVVQPGAMDRLRTRFEGASCSWGT